MGKDTAAVARLQQGRGFLMAFGHQDAAFVKTATALFQGESHIGQRLFGMGAQMCRERGAIGVQGRFAAPRKAEHMEREIAVFRGRAGRCLFQDHMRIGAAHAKRIDGSAARGVLPGPVIEPVIDAEGRALKRDRRVRRFIA